MRIFLCLLLVTFIAQADSTPDLSDTNNKESIHALSPEKLDAIRLIGRNVLLAKKSGKDEPADKEQLLQLRTTVDQLIAAEAMPSQSTGIRLANKAPAPSVSQGTGASTRDAVRTHAWKVSTILRQEASQLHSKTKTPAKHEEYSAGFPVGQQRGRLFEQLADKLEATLDDNNTDRLAQLRVLRDQLSPEKHGIIDAPLVHETPTLQAMPWEEPIASTKKTHHKNKSIY